MDDRSRNRRWSADATIADTSSPEFTACADKKWGYMRYSTTPCNEWETTVVINQRGVPGPTGPAGPTGPRGRRGTAGADGSGGSAITELSICGAGGSSLCKVGVQGPGGGTIFFVDYQDIYSDFDYLEAAPVGWGDGISVAAGETTGTATDDPRLYFCSDTSTDFGLSTPESYAVGAGATNTSTTSSSCTTGAITAASDYTSVVGSKSDWFLPSAGEMQLMSRTLLFQGAGGLLDQEYATSTERDASSTVSWWHTWDYGDQTQKTAPRFVRPIRKF